jgi:aminoglycoside phosphotransferase (APT) family kinase protein
MQQRAAAVSIDAIGAWCRAQLGAMPVGELFRAGYLSLVVGLRLEDGREVVVKVRPQAPRLTGCFEVHRRLHEAGFPCPQPLAGPAALAGFTATAESYVPGGDRFPASGRVAEPYASALAALVATARALPDVPALAPNPPWTAWNHAQDGLWPWPDDRFIDLNSVRGPDWVDVAGRAARDRLRRTPPQPAVVGHGDWYTDNIRWAGDELYAVHDWDSLIADSEQVVAGLAASVYPAVHAGSEATVEETTAFLDAYGAARGRKFSAVELEACWAAGLWIRSFDAKKQFATGGHVRSLTPAEAQERARRAGAGSEVRTFQVNHEGPRDCQARGDEPSGP